mgnify:CR=1 FL=1
MKKYLIKPTLVFLIGLTLVSCRKEELPVRAPDLGNITTSKVELSSTYENQVYFDLSSNSNKGTSNKIDWDLGFSCATGNPYIIINTSKVMLASLVSDKTFSEISNTSNFNSSTKVDHPTGRIDSLAIKGGSIFVLDRGYNGAGTHQGYFKMEILSHDNSTFTGKFANVDGSNEQTITINKNSTYNFVYMKWNPTSVITTPTIEPAKEEWDLIFTQFTEIFYEPEFMPYSVVGCLSNTYNTKSLRITEKTFDEIDLEYAETLTLSTDRDRIGYNWKTFMFEQNKYVIDYNKIYVIQDNEGFFYKLRFVDFYSSTGVKGTPTFEYQRL